MKRVLIAGGAGFIGSHTSVELLDAGYEIAIIDNFSNSKPEMIEKMQNLNKKAGRWMSEYTYGASSVRNSDAAKSYQEFEGLAKQIVQDQLRKIYGAQFTEKEGERFFKSMGLSPKLAPEVRWNLFMNAINDLRMKSGLNPVGVGGVASAPRAAPVATTGSIVNKDGFITL